MVFNLTTFDSVSMCGYEQKTTFWQDFSIAEHLGVDAIEDTYGRAFNEWKRNVQYLTELVMVLNWKLWEHYEQGNSHLAEIYDILWKRTDKYCMDNLEGEDLNYFLKTTD